SPNTSSVFNEAPPADAAPSPSEPSSVMVAKASTTTSSSADAGVSSAPSAASASVASSSAVTSSECANTSTTCPSSADASVAATQPPSPSRYARVSPAVLKSVKASLSFRKSCLKRSKSSALPPSAFPSDDDVVTPRNQMKPTTDAPLTVESTEPVRPVQKNRRRCWECKVKVGLAAVTCRCEYTFCGKHRYAEEHQCAFNFKTAGKRKLEAENPLVVPRKVARIN
ncbi:hypothetical protein BBJ28_00016827, partial [Nothophytophthora sp. Chile5]